MPAQGVVYVHSAPAAMCPHIEWAVAGVLGGSFSLPWEPQRASPGMYRAERAWSGDTGAAGSIASALRGWHSLRYEITENPGAEFEGARYSATPGLGIFHAVIGIHGDIMVSESRLRAAAERPSGSLRDDILELLGSPWDDELEPFRQAGRGSPVRWLHRVG
jgi:hypothetical protein